MEETTDNDTLEYEPEWCEDCMEQMEEEGIEYTFDYHVKDGVAYCEHCLRPL